jgi:AcrR family transcriptional regulator
MDPLTPKQIEIRERERRILELACPVVVAGGVSALSMEAIAQELQTAKGTIYNHYRNKEEIVLALAIAAMEQRLQLFHHASMLRGGSRERVAAIGIACEVYADRFPAAFQIEAILRHEAIWEKTSAERQSVMRSCESRCMHVVAGIIRDGVASGDLNLTDVAGMPAASQIEEIVFGLWSLVHGGMLLERTSPSLADIGIASARRAIRRNCNALLDGLGWQPLYDLRAYEAWIEQVRKDLEHFAIHNGSFLRRSKI